MKILKSKFTTKKKARYKARYEDLKIKVYSKEKSKKTTQKRKTTLKKQNK